VAIPVLFYISLFIFLPFFICTLCSLSFFALLFEFLLLYFQLFWPQWVFWLWNWSYTCN